METKKKKSLASRIPAKVWLLISFLAAMLVWYLLSIIPQTSRGFPNMIVTIKGLITMIQRGVFFQDIASSLISVFGGYALGFVIALPVAILMAWYLPVRNILNPWIQFIRNIPPLALRSPDRHCGRRGTASPNYRHHHRLLSDHVRHHLSRAWSTWTRPSLRPPGYLGPAIKISLFGSSRQPLSPSSSLPYGWVLPWP